MTPTLARPTTLRLKAKTQPGKRLMLTLPELEDDEEVEVIVLRADPPVEPPRQFANMMEYVRSLTPIQRTPEEWAELEKEFREDRDAWDN